MMIIVCGDRNWSNRQLVNQVLNKYYNELTRDVKVLVHGGCRGADLIASEEGRKIGFKIKEYSANWDLYGKAAGPVRNEKMLKENLIWNPKVIAFHNDIKSSKGTKHMVNIAKKAGLEVVVVTEQNIK